MIIKLLGGGFMMEYAQTLCLSLISVILNLFQNLFKQGDVYKEKKQSSAVHKQSHSEFISESHLERVAEKISAGRFSTGRYY